MRPVRDLALAATDAVLPTRLLARRVRQLQAAVQENADLALPLTEQLGRIEADLVPLLERRVALHGDGRPVDGGTRG